MTRIRLEITRVVGVRRGKDVLTQTVGIAKALARTTVYAREIRITQHVVKGPILQHKHKNMLNITDVQSAFSLCPIGKCNARY